MMSDVFSELNSVCIYTSNNYTFYMSDDISMDEIQSFEEITIYFSLVDAISYWLAECKQIIELFDLFYYAYVFNISLTGKPKEYYYERNMVVLYSECIGTEINKNHIFLKWTPEAFGNLNQTTNIMKINHT